MRDLKELSQDLWDEVLKLNALEDLISSKSKSAEDHEFPMSVITANGFTMILKDCTNKILEVYSEIDGIAEQDNMGKKKEEEMSKPITAPKSIEREGTEKEVQFAGYLAKGCNITPDEALSRLLSIFSTDMVFRDILKDRVKTN